MAHLPEPLEGGVKLEDATLKDVPTPEVLSSWLQERGLDISEWGKGNTKEVKAYWKEIKLNEAALQVWKTAQGSIQPVRVVYVLRAKVTSPQNYKRNIFLFNTWQQFSDGRVRTRNGLLSEKLETSEMPLEDNLHKVCERAVTEEEMQRVESAACKIGPENPAPIWDEGCSCPLKVVEAHFVDHTIEIETSKSFPGLLTMYHLYTVDIVCTGLPPTDFNTLEFNHPETGETPSLKYIHAWSWLEWSQIKRYLLDESKLKERKKRGSFTDPQALRAWLSQFQLDLQAWGQMGAKSVEDLYDEVEAEETQLELWGKTDGAPLLMRVVHVVQIRVISNDPRMGRKFLFQTWQQTKDGQVKTVNRFLSKKVSTSKPSFEEADFQQAVEATISEELKYLVDAHFQLHPENLPKYSDYKCADLKIGHIAFDNHRCEVEESPSYKGISTMYHLYTMSAEVEGLPVADFASIIFKSRRSDGGRSSYAKATKCIGLSWVTWGQVLATLNSRTTAIETQKNVLRDAMHHQKETLERIRKTHLPGLSTALGQLSCNGNDADAKTAELKKRIEDLEQMVLSLEVDAMEKVSHSSDFETLSNILPPSMVSKMAATTVASQEFMQAEIGKQLAEARDLKACRSTRKGEDIVAEASRRPSRLSCFAGMFSR